MKAKSEKKVDSSKDPSENKLTASIQSTPLPEDLLLHTTIPSLIKRSSNSLNLRGIEIVSMITYFGTFFCSIIKIFLTSWFELSICI